MSISAVVTRGYGQGLKYIAVRGYASRTSPTPPPAPAVILLGGGPGNPHHYHAPYSAYKEAQYLAEKRAELERIDDEIAQAEHRRLAALKRAQAKLVAEKAAKKLAATEATLQKEINRLRIERVWLMRLIDDEEAILVLLLSQPFH